MVAEHNQHCEQTLMFTDIVGYSRLMGRNEAMAIDMLGDYRKILLSHIEQQGGQLVEFVGDAIFARFNTASSATAAAIAIQQHLQAFNEVRDKKLPPLQTRIGLHKGEVMLRDGAVFGDSVNIAARLEPLAVADGICISQTVYDEVRITLSSPAKRLGVQALKNIEQKIRVYLIKPSGIGWRDHLFYFLRGLNKKIHAYRYPLTACLFALIVAGFYFIPRWLVPGYAANYVEIADFQNLMNEKGDADYFSAGITEAVRSQLADMRDVYIVDAKEGIHAPIRLEGSVQRLGDNLRIAYRLFRRKDNVQIAGGKLDGTYQDIFILQDRLVGEIARYLADEFELQNFRPAPLKLTNDITAYDYYLRGLEYLERPSSHENTDEAIKFFNTSLIHDSAFSLANSGICESYWRKYELSNSERWLVKAEKFCLLALSQDSFSVVAYKSIGNVYRDMGRLPRAKEFLEKGLLINPENASLLVALASVRSLLNDNRGALALYKKAIEIDPHNWIPYFGYAQFLTSNGENDKAIKIYNKVLSFTPENILALNNIGANFLFGGDFDGAAKYFAMATNLEPSAASYANAGSVYYVAGKFEQAADMYLKALKLESTNYQWMVYLGDALKYIPGKKALADIYFKEAIASANKDLNTGDVARRYQYLSRSYLYFSNLDSAKNYLEIANRLESGTIESCYSNLRYFVIAVDESQIRKYVKCLLSVEYSGLFLLRDPDFSILHESKFKNLFDI